MLFLKAVVTNETQAFYLRVRGLIADLKIALKIGDRLAMTTIQNSIFNSFVYTYRLLSSAETAAQLSITIAKRLVDSGKGTEFLAFMQKEFYALYATKGESVQKLLLSLIDRKWEKPELFAELVADLAGNVRFIEKLVTANDIIRQEEIIKLWESIKNLNKQNTNINTVLIDADKLIDAGIYIEGVKKIDLMGGAMSQIGGDFINIDIVASTGINGDATKLSQFIKPGTIEEIVVSNPYSPNASSPQELFLIETSKVLKRGGILKLNGNISNKFFEKTTQQVAEASGFTISEFRIPLLPEFQHMKFYQTGGTKEIPIDRMLTTVLIKK